MSAMSEYENGRHDNDDGDYHDDNGDDNNNATSLITNT